MASYPRSGNTWLRLMLNSYERGGKPVNINNLPISNLMYNRSFADTVLGQAMGDLLPAEILALRPTVMRAVRDSRNNPVMLKTHDMRLRLADGEWQLPADVSLGGVYLVRDPRDVALSLARFMDLSIDKTIDVMGNSEQMLANSITRQNIHLVNILGGWSEHVLSWMSPVPFPVHVVRYEDMRRDPVSTLAGVLPALGYAVDMDKIRAAVAETSLETLRRQEEANGFVEYPSPNRFFGEGRVGGWSARLGSAQAERICADHRFVMQQLGYLD
ncbi:sulfotransferase domain-containing protein [Rhodospirillum rubrum]|nr:sulfotransferase domain-containing protein [Rhodospirillum rubrum]